MAVKELEALEALRALPMQHNVYFLDCGGSLICPPVRVPHGQGVRPPAYTPDISREFLGWSRSTARVTQDVYCVAVTREREEPAGKEASDCRVLVLELRGQRLASLFPLGNWAKGETLTRDDLDCLHLRRVEKLRPFRCPIAGDTLLAVTDFGVRAFDAALRPLEGLLELMPARQPDALSAARDESMLAKEA
jgi:hypothetical protein